MNKYAVAGMVSLALAGTVQEAAAQAYPAQSGGPASAWYLGAGMGWANASIPDKTVDAFETKLSNAINPGFTLVSHDKSSTAAKIFLGYRFMPNFAVEGGYALVGKTRVDMDFRSGLASLGTFNVEYKMSAEFIDAVGIIPFAEKWSLIGRVGVAYGRTSATFGGTPISVIASNDDTSKSRVHEKFGAGVDYNVNPTVTLRAEWERYRMPDPFSDETIAADAATLSLLYRF